MRKNFKKVATVAIIAVATIVTAITFQSCSQENQVTEDSNSKRIIPLTEKENKSISNFYEAIVDFNSSQQILASNITRRASSESDFDELLNVEDESILMENIGRLDSCAIEMLITFGFSPHKVSDLQMNEVPLVATITANELVSSLETIEAICPETPVTEGPDGVWVSQKQLREMSIDCLAEMIDLDPKTIMGIVTVKLASKEGLLSALTEIAKIAKANVAKYLSAGSLAICVLYFDWGLCMKGKLDSL